MCQELPIDNGCWIIIEAHAISSLWLKVSLKIGLPPLHPYSTVWVQFISKFEAPLHRADDKKSLPICFLMSIPQSLKLNQVWRIRKYPPETAFCKHLVSSYVSVTTLFSFCASLDGLIVATWKCSSAVYRRRLKRGN